MRHSHLRLIILSGTVVLICLLVVQVYWLQRAFDAAEKQFDHSVQMALKKVADSVAKDPEVKKLSSNFFFVTTNSELNNTSIDGLIKKEFMLRSLNMDYELGIYNADDDTLVYGQYVEATKGKLAGKEHAILRSNSAEKNFAIYFPQKQSYLAAELGIWIFSTIVLLLMIGFFGYAIASLLRERRFSELKNDFISNMTHEFKTPVTNIKIAGEILSSKIGVQEGMKVYVDILLKENEKLNRKIEHVLAGASADHLRRPVLAIVDVHRLINDCAEAFQLKVQQRSGKMQFELNAKDSTILGDRELLAQAISNVIDNAEKYSTGQPQITVSTKDSRNGVEIHIVDHGIGISEEFKTKVFEKFFRARTGTLHNIKGFGLGLNFARTVIHSHKGRISLFSEINKGTDVRIFLPKA